MENLTPLEQETLKILEQLEYCCESAELHNSEKIKKNKFLEITFGDINFRALNRPENIRNTEKYLQKNGVNFEITFDLENDSLLSRVDDGHQSQDLVTLGIINGKDIDTIKKNIGKIISKLSSKKTAPTKISVSISYDIKIGQFIFNDKETVEVTGKQKDVSDCLFEAGKNIKVSWDEISEKISEISNETLTNYKTTLIKKSINGAVNEINRKTERYLESQKLLIGLKDNEYWFQYTVKKTDKNG